MDLSGLRRRIESTGTQLAFVHMGSPGQGREFFSKYGLPDVELISDPDAEIYRAFGLDRQTVVDLFDLKLWKRGFESAFLSGHGAGVPVGDPFRMPGVFLIHKGRILREFRHETPADRPDYLEMAGLK